jgi:hypothetical protein
MKGLPFKIKDSLRKWHFLGQIGSFVKPSMGSQQFSTLWKAYFGPPIGVMVCLSKCPDGVVDCFCESVGQSVYRPRIGFLGHFD